MTPAAAFESKRKAYYKQTQTERTNKMYTELEA
jgi:hypothetical protein